MNAALHTVCDQMTHDVRVMMECALRGTSLIERNRARPVTSVECDVESGGAGSSASGVQVSRIVRGRWNPRLVGACVRCV